MAFKDKEVSCFGDYPTSSTPYVKLLCVVTGKQIAEHHDIVCETPAWAIAYLKKKNIDATTSRRCQHHQGMMRRYWHEI